MHAVFELLICMIVWFGLVGFYGISTVVGYWIPNPVYIYILIIFMIRKKILSITFLNEPELFLAKKLNGYKYCYITVTINISHLFAHSLFYLTHRADPYQVLPPWPEWTWKQWQWRSIPYSPNLKGLGLSIRCFNVISKILVGVCVWGGLTPLQRCSRCILQLQSTGPRLSNVIPGHSFGGSYSSAEMQSVYSSTPADWAKIV